MVWKKEENIILLENIEKNTSIDDISLLLKKSKRSVIFQILYNASIKYKEKIPMEIICKDFKINKDALYSYMNM